MHALEAHEASMQSIKPKMDMIFSAIKKATEREQFGVSVKVDCSDEASMAILIELRKLKYHVSCLYTKRTKTYDFNIHWEHANQ
jgi:hypothetical protein